MSAASSVTASAPVGHAFASYRALLEVSGRRVARETARIFSLGADGKFTGELSYSMETAA